MKVRNSFLSLVLLALSGISAFGQQKLITNVEFSDGINIASSKAREMTQRVTSIEKTLVDGLVTETIERISESIPGKSSRSLIRTTKGHHVSEKEWIRLNNIGYFRENGGPWKKEEDTGFRRLEFGGGLSRPPGGVQYSTETVTLDGEPMQKYEIFLVNTKERELIFQQRRTWIGIDGLIHRKNVVNGKLAPMVETHRTETTYEYDPKIKIEVPLN